MNVTQQDVETAIWLAEYVGLNGNGFNRDEELSTSTMAVNIADTYCLSIQPKDANELIQKDWLYALRMLEKAASIRHKIETSS